MPIQVRIATSMGSFNFTLFNELQDQGWELPVSGQPIAVAFDPDNWLLKDIIGTTFTDELQNLPTTFSLFQNYPNPFNPSTVINYQLPEAIQVSLKVYDELGREVETLVDEFQQAGIHNATFKTQSLSLPSGVYFYTLKAGEFIETKKMILLK